MSYVKKEEFENLYTYSMDLMFSDEDSTKCLIKIRDYIQKFILDHNMDLEEFAENYE